MSKEEFISALAETRAMGWELQLGLPGIVNAAIVPRLTLRCACGCPIEAVAEMLKPGMGPWNGRPFSASRVLGLSLALTGEIMAASDQSAYVKDKKLREELLAAVGVTGV